MKKIRLLLTIAIFVSVMLPSGRLAELYAARSTSDQGTVRYNHAFLTHDEADTILVVGTNKGENAGNLSLAMLRTSAEDGKMAATFAPLAEDDQLKGHSIKGLALFNNQLPVVAVASGDNKNKVFMLADILGTKVMASENLKDAEGEEIDKGVVAVAASAEHVFALVPQKEKAFDAAGVTGRGVAVLAKKVGEADEGEEGKQAEETLAQLYAGNIKDTEHHAAARLDVSIDPELFAFVDGQGEGTISQALIGKDGELWWDNELQRLYVGLSEVRRDGNNKQGGVLGLAMGYFDQKANDGNGAAFRLAPIVRNPEKEMFYVDNGHARDYAAAVDAAYALVNVAQRAKDTAANNGDGSVKAALGDYTKLVDEKTMVANAADPAVKFLTNRWEGLTQKDALWGAVKTIVAAGQDNNNTTALDAVKTAAVGAGGGAGLVKTNRDNAMKLVNRTWDAVNAEKNEYINGLNNIVGYYYDGTTRRRSANDVLVAKHNGYDEPTLTVRKVRTMHTSTGRTYLIVNSVISTNPVSMGSVVLAEAEDWLYALPLIDYEKDGDAEMKGTIAKVHHDTGIAYLDTKTAKMVEPHVFTDMPRDNHAPVKIGKQNPIPGSWVQDVFVQGDSVYVALAGPNNKNRGMYKSTALFNKDGLIIDWTPAERVMGFVGDVRSAALDTKTGSFYAITDRGNIGRITEWGKGDQVRRGSEEGLLSSVLEKACSQLDGGVHHLIPFDRFTPGFVQGDFAMSVALGRDKVVLIQTGKTEAQGFTPTQTFEDKKTVQIITHPVLQHIAPLTSAAMTVNGANPMLIVSGFGGMAKITFQRLLSSLETDNLDTLIQPNLATGVVRFPNAFFDTPVFRVMRGKEGGAERIFALTMSNVQTYDPAAGAPAAHTAPINEGVDMLVLRHGDPARANDSFLLVANHAGLHISQDLATFRSLGSVPGPVLHMQYTSGMQDKRPSIPGNLYVLVDAPRLDTVEKEDATTGAITTSTEQSATRRAVQVYRYVLTWNAARASVAIDPLDKDVAGKVVPYVQFDDLRSMIAVDGSLLFNALPKDVSVADFVRLLPITKRNSDLATMLEHEQILLDKLDIDTEASSNVSVISRDPSSGAWVIPGDWGVRVNE